MPIASSHSTTLYTLGRGILYISAWVGETPPSWPYTDVGNCPRFEVEVTEEVLDHYSKRTGLREKDKTVILEAGYNITFDLDEISVYNLKMFLKAQQSGSRMLYANMALDLEYALRFVSDNPVGPNEIWDFWRVKLSPGGPFSLIADEWSTLTFTGTGLSDVTNHPESKFFTVEFQTTTTTTSTTTTTA